jgi:FixJ family two-component response regulator
LSIGPREPAVFVIDDDEDMRNSLQWLIESIGLAVVSFASAEQFLAARIPKQAGCLLLDVRMPGMGGLRLLEHLRRHGGDLPVIFFTGHGDVPMAVRALKAGAFDFLEKPASHQQILDRIRDALAADHDLRESAAERAAIAARLGRLTYREREVLDQIVEGGPNKVIAARLGISEKTLEKHRASVMEKMQARSLAHLIRMTLLR